MEFLQHILIVISHDSFKSVARVGIKRKKSEKETVLIESIKILLLLRNDVRISEVGPGVPIEASNVASSTEKY